MFKDQIKLLIAASHGATAGQAYSQFRPTVEELTTLGEAGKYVLHVSPVLPGACVMMSALWAKTYQFKYDLPIHVVAGSLRVSGHPVFQIQAGTNWSKVFTQSDFGWDGHCWVVFGTHIGDISVLRTARSVFSPKVLAEHVRRRFGPKNALFIATETDAEKLGFEFQPEYVLTDSQVDQLAYSAIKVWRVGQE